MDERTLALINETHELLYKYKRLKYSLRENTNQGISHDDEVAERMIYPPLSLSSNTCKMGPPTSHSELLRKKPWSYCKTEDEWDDSIAKSIFELYTTSKNKTHPEIISTHSSPAKPKQAKLSHIKSHEIFTEIMKNKPIRVAPLWYKGSGSLPFIWCHLSLRNKPGNISFNVEHSVASWDCKHEICLALRECEAQNKYETFVQLVEIQIAAYEDHFMSILGTQEHTDINRVASKLRMQLVATILSFADKLISKNVSKSARSFCLIIQAGKLLHKSIPHSSSLFISGQASIIDSLSFYFYRRKKCRTSLIYCKRAREQYDKAGYILSSVRCMIHEACVCTSLELFKKSTHIILNAIELLEKKCCLDCLSHENIALIGNCMFNLSINSLGLLDLESASEFIDLSLRLAQASLGYSSRYITYYEKTRIIILDEILRRSQMANVFP